MSNWGYFVAAMVASVLYTGALLFVRERVRSNRQRLIRELGALFFPNAASTVPAFDYILAKYEMKTAAELRGQGSLGKAPRAPGLLVAAIPYILLCAIGFVMVFLPLATLTRPEAWLLGPNLFWTMGGEDAPARNAAAVFAAAFMGGYLMTGRVLLRAVQNYELTQLVFLRSAGHLAVGAISAMMAVHILHATGLPNLGGVGLAAMLGVGFFAGYMPDFGLINLARRAQVRSLKTIDDKAMDAVYIQPLELLDGIDYDTRYRLESAGFYDVQNLAVANPLLIYVETPYSLYQAFDWVLQAQLCVAVGSGRFRSLRDLNIRTSFDLERAVLADDAPDELVRMIGAVLFPATPSPTEPTIRHLAMVVLDDLHVHRLRQLWMHIFKQVSGASGTDWIYRTVGGAACKACAGTSGAAGSGSTAGPAPATPVPDALATAAAPTGDAAPTAGASTDPISPDAKDPGK
jgi:hypothetical protein